MAVILVVDDDERNRRLAATALGSAHHEVIEAAGGDSGFDLALSRRPDLILLDVHMAPPDGLGTLARLRSDERTRQTVVVAFTAQAMKGDAERLLAAGFDGYISKPVRYREFLDTVERLLDGGER